MHDNDIITASYGFVVLYISPIACDLRGTETTQKEEASENNGSIMSKERIGILIHLDREQLLRIIILKQ